MATIIRYNYLYENNWLIQKIYKKTDNYRILNIFSKLYRQLTESIQFCIKLLNLKKS